MYLITCAACIIGSNFTALAADEIDESQAVTADAINEMFEVAKDNDISVEDFSMDINCIDEEGNAQKVEAYIYQSDETASVLSDDQTNTITAVYAVPRSAGNTMSNAQYDSSYSVKGYITVTYSTKTVNSSTCYLLTHVSGGWTILDSSVTLSNRKVIYHSGPIHLANGSMSLSSNTFNFSTGYGSTHWTDTDYCSCAAGSYVTIKHGSSSSWNLEFTCGPMNPSAIG